MSARRYPVREIFDSYQGEGARAGRRSIFVRFAGCNLWSGREEDRGRGKGACSLWCDTDFAEPVEGKLTAIEIASRVASLRYSSAAWVPWVVFTGGEPLLSLDAELVELLDERGVRIAIETNGRVPAPEWLVRRMSSERDSELAPIHVCMSPKLALDGSYVAPAIGPIELAEVKVVLGAGGSEDWTDEKLAMLERDVLEAGRCRRWFVQPVASRSGAPDPDAIARCVEVARARDWDLSVQAHKLLGLR